MTSHQMKRMVFVLACVCATAAVWPTVASAIQNSYGFNQTWLILGPYYRKDTGNGSDASIRLDYLTDGAITQTNIIPTTGMVINTNYGLGQCGSFSFAWRTVRNGYDVPTIFPWTDPDDWINFRGGTVNGDTVSVFDQNNPVSQPIQGNNRLDNTMVIAFAWANNVTGGNLTARIGSGRDDSIQVLVDGVERQINTGGGGSQATNEVRNASGSFTLTPGKHLVMVKVANGGGGFGFRVRLQRNNTTGVNQAAGFTASEVLWETDGTGWPGYPPPAAPTPRTVSGNRWIGPRRGANGPYTPGQPIRVDVDLTTGGSAASPRATAVVREYPPSGWAISGTSASLGTVTVLTTTTAYGSPAWTGNYIRWDLGEVSTSPIRLSYNVTPPLSATGNFWTTGTVESNIWRVIGGNPYGNIYGREVGYWGPTAPMGIFDWAGQIGLPPMADTWTARQNHPPFSSGTAQTGDPQFALGSASYAGGIYTVRSSGHDLWDNSDAGYVLAKRVVGDFVLQADVMFTSMPGLPGQAARRTDGVDIAKLALMARNSLHSGSANGAAAIWSYYRANPAIPFHLARRNVAWNGTDRPSNTSDAVDVGYSSPTVVPVSLKLVRRGNRIETYQRRAGVWVKGSAGIWAVTDLTSSTAFACLALTSHQNNTSVEAQFSNVSISPVPCVSATRSFLSSTLAPGTTDRYTSLPVTVRVFLKYGGGGPAALTVRDYGPPGWNILSSTPVGVVDDGSTITWTLSNFNADTTLSYTMAAPPGSILAAPFGAGFVNDQTNSLWGWPVDGPNMLQAFRATVFQQGRFPTSSYADTRDCQIFQWYSGTRNNGWNDEMEEGENNLGNNDLKVPLLRFDTTAIPPWVTVWNAKLMLFHNRNRTAAGGPNGTSGTVHRIYAAKLNRPWGEGRGTGVDGTYANLGEARWLEARAFVSPWASPGARGGALDGDMPESFADASSFTINTWVVWDVTRMVTDWVQSPMSNQGLKLSQEDRNTTSLPHAWPGWPDGRAAFGIFDFRTRNYGTSSLRPILVVEAWQPATLSASHWELYR